MTRKYLDNHLGTENERAPFDLDRTSKGDRLRMRSPERGCWRTREQQKQVQRRPLQRCTPRAQRNGPSSALHVWGPREEPVPSRHQAPDPHNFAFLPLVSVAYWTFLQVSNFNLAQTAQVPHVSRSSLLEVPVMREARGG